MPPRLYKTGQYVKVKVNARGKTEIGRISAVLGDELSVETKSGFEVKATTSAVSPALLLILDLNGVLVNRSGRKQCALRPHLEDFLSYVFKNFVVGVWSSCERRNGEIIIEQAFGEWAPELSFQMFRDECTPAPTPDNAYATKKDLANLWVKFHGVFDQNNTIIIDDSAEKCSHLRNALCPLPYDAIDESDKELLRIVDVLKSILETGNFFEILDAEQIAFAGSMKARQVVVSNGGAASGSVSAATVASPGPSPASTGATPVSSYTTQSGAGSGGPRSGPTTPCMPAVAAPRTPNGGRANGGFSASPLSTAGAANSRNGGRTPPSCPPTPTGTIEMLAAANPAFVVVGGVPPSASTPKGSVAQSIRPPLALGE